MATPAAAKAASQRRSRHYMVSAPGESGKTKFRMDDVKHARLAVAMIDRAKPPLTQPEIAAIVRRAKSMGVTVTGWNDNGTRANG